MKIAPYQIIAAILLAAVAGCIGAIAADKWGHSASEGGLHAFVHNELLLTEIQKNELDVVEAKFASEQKRQELALRSANVELAQAMEREQEYGQEVAAAIDNVHARMGDMQKATVQHVFAMRRILNPAQQRKFDRQVSAALTHDPRE